MVGSPGAGVGAENRRAASEDRFLKGCLRRIGEARMPQALNGSQRPTARARRNEGGPSSYVRADDGVGPGQPASFYRFEESAGSGRSDMDLRDAIQRIAPEWPSYGCCA